MAITSFARTALRSATADHHEQVDQLFSQATLSDKGGYARFLMAQAAAFLPTEEALDRDGAEQAVSDWPSRRRGALLKADLDALGLPCTPPEASLRFEGTPALLGGIYVLEGSRLGGAVLKRSVPDGWPMRFLAPAPSGSWRNLMAALDRHLLGEEEIEAAAKAACRVFELFERGGRHFLSAELS